MGSDTKGHKRPPEIPKAQDPIIPYPLQPIFSSTSPVPTQERRKPHQLPSQSEPTLPQALVDPAVSRGQDGQAGRERFRDGQAVSNSCGIQALCPEDAKHIKLASVERAEVLRGVVMSRCQSIRRVLVGG